MNEFNVAGSNSITVLDEEQLDTVVGGWGGRHNKHGGGNKRHGGYGMHRRNDDGEGRRGEGRRGGRPIIVVVIDARTIVNVVNNVV
jgi:hypothetical protein